MVWFVSRQRYWPEGECMVEIAAGGRDYANPDMLSPKYPGEAEEYADPREAVKAALYIRDLWKKDEPSAPIAVGEGATGGYTMPFDSSEDDALIAWAEKEYEGLEKCAECGKILSASRRDWIQIYEPPYGGLDGTLMNETMDPEQYFCSEECSDRAYDKAYTFWAEQERDEWIAKIDDTHYAAVRLIDTRGRRDMYADLDEEGETLFRIGPTGNGLLEIDLGVLLSDDAGIWYENTMMVIDHAREVFTLQTPLVEIGG